MVVSSTISQATFLLKVCRNGVFRTRVLSFSGSPGADPFNVSNGQYLNVAIFNGTGFVESNLGGFFYSTEGVVGLPMMTVDLASFCF